TRWATSAPVCRYTGGGGTATLTSGDPNGVGATPVGATAAPPQALTSRAARTRSKNGSFISPTRCRNLIARKVRRNRDFAVSTRDNGSLVFGHERRLQAAQPPS